MEPFWWLLVGHALADYPLQSDFMAKEKNPWYKIDPARIPPGQTPNIFWPWVLSAHSLIHGGMVALITGSVFLGVLETVSHWFIDLAKCAGWSNIHQDQLLHIACKFLWVAILTMMRN